MRREDRSLAHPRILISLFAHRLRNPGSLAIYKAPANTDRAYSCLSIERLAKSDSTYPWLTTERPVKTDCAYHWLSTEHPAKSLAIYRALSEDLIARIFDYL